MIPSIEKNSFSKPFDIQKVWAESEVDETKGFASALKNNLAELNTMLQQSDAAQENVAIGKSENLHEAMITTEKAEVSLKYALQIRNKALEAYHEILRMQF